MTSRSDDDGRAPTVAAVTPGPERHATHRFAGDHLDLPILLVAALEAAGTTTDAFLARLRHGAIWQDQSLRSPDRRIDIQAYLPPDGLRCVIRVAENIWYHHPLETLHVWHMPLPTIGEREAVPLARVLRHDLLDPLPITVREVTYLNARKPELGTCIRVHMRQIRSTFVPIDEGPALLSSEGKNMTDEDEDEQEVQEARRRGAAERLAATAETAPAIVEAAIEVYIGVHRGRQGTREWDLELCALAAHKVPILTRELGADHPLVREWAAVMNTVSGRLYKQTIRRIIDAVA